MAKVPAHEGIETESPAGRVIGEVRIKGTDMPVSGVVAHAYAVGVGSHNGDDVEEVSLGSALVESGRFEIRYTDELLASLNGSRRSILVKVFGPDAGRPLAESDRRTSAAPEEVFLLTVDAEELAAQGQPDALTVAAASAVPAVAAGAVAAKLALVERLAREIGAERRKTVAKRHSEDAELDAKIRDRVLSELTGLSPDAKVWKRMVRPGEDPASVANSYQKEVLEEEKFKNHLKKVGAETYVVLSEDEHKALGDPPDPEKVRALLSGTRSEGGVVRDDPMLHVCRTAADVPNPFAEESSAPSPTPTAEPGPVSSADGKIKELVGSIEPPDNIQLTGPQGDAAAASRVFGLSIAKGPADLPATYEFHRLDMAFDHVWEDARAEGYVEAVKAVYRQVEAAGGDAAAALESSEPLLRALRREAQFAAVAAPAESDGPGVIYMQPKGSKPKLPGFDPKTDIKDIKYGESTPPGGPSEPTPTSEPDPNLGHPFTVFAPGTVNFGLLVTYQQRFEPQDYQVGRMIGTRTLGPKETYSFTTRQVLKKSFNRKQMESNQRMRREEAEDTSRDEAEVVRRSQAKTNFAMSTSGSYDLGPIGEGTVSTNLGKDTESSSQETKRSQRSAVRKAAQEVKNETKIELENAESSEIEVTETRNIKNENEELVATCVFWELQRRFKVSETLHRITPVALVAQKVPSVAEINEEWILRYDWIIRRFLPDDSFEPALTYLVTSAAGDRLVLQDLKTHMENLRDTVRELGQQVSYALATANKEYRLLGDYVSARAETEGDRADGVLESLWGAVAGDGKDAQLDKIRVLEEAAKERYEKAAAYERDLRARMDRELSALQVATDEYTKALATQANRQVEINRLIEHVRQNILLYMHGIWSYEHPHQRILREHKMTAPRLISKTPTYELEPSTVWPPGITPEAGKTAYKVKFTTSVDPNVANEDERATLAELLDLHSWIGMFANYSIYPLKQSNALTDFMMTPYLDNTFGLRDPDAVGNWTLEQFTEYVRCLKDNLKPAAYKEIEDTLRAQYQELLTSPHRDGEEITIPSNGVYMQMLIDTGKVLEEYKEAHRKMDVLKVREEVRTAAIDNVRRAKMVLADQFEDPNIESVKNVYYHGPAPHDGEE